ncbi:hypothetical protein KIPB_016959, partial [Kipferlia bialata]|eukprot:g16959.t1
MDENKSGVVTKEEFVSFVME